VLAVAHQLPACGEASCQSTFIVVRHARPRSRVPKLYSTRDGEAEMPEILEQEGLRRVGPCLRGDILHRARTITPRRSCGLSLSFCNWYRTLFADCFGALGKADLQDTIIEARFDLVLVHGVGKPH
jgi:hypothetical protein